MTQVFEGFRHPVDAQLRSLHLYVHDIFILTFTGISHKVTFIRIEHEEELEGNTPGLACMTGLSVSK
jgi:hypothetical protein